MPAQNKGTSKQDYETPRDFLDAVEARWGALDVDLACTLANAKAPMAIAEENVDSLTVPWAAGYRDRNLWLNPPFKLIDPWAEKCALEGPKMGRGRIFMLTPASIGTNWFHEHVRGKAMVLGISPRLTFVGASDPYPKDLMLSIFAPGMVGFDSWRWKP